MKNGKDCIWLLIQRDKLIALHLRFHNRPVSHVCTSIVTARATLQLLETYLFTLHKFSTIHLLIQVTTASIAEKGTKSKRFIREFVQTWYYVGLLYQVINNFHTMDLDRA